MPENEEKRGAVHVTIAKAAGEKRGINKYTQMLDGEIAAAAASAESKHYLEAPLPMRVLYFLYDNSTALRPCIDVYKTNIDGFGQSFPEKYTDDEVKAAILRDAERENEDGKLERKHRGTKEFETKIIKADDSKPEWDATVEARFEELRQDIDREHDEMDHFFEYACPGLSFVELRMQTREDLEISGNAYWEVVRSEKTGQPAKIYPAPARYITLCPASDPIVVPTREQVNALEFRIVNIRRRFRTYVQDTEGGNKTYFKEFGDPRIVSGRSGIVYKDEAALQAAEGRGGEPAPVATEMIHFTVHSGTSPYGIPRWLGAYKLIAGLMEKDQVDLDYFTAGTIPPMIICVSGHTLKLGQDMINILTQHFKAAKERGSASFNDVPIIEATSEPGSTLVPKIEFKELMDARLKDATHIRYAEMCKEYIRQMFRLPKFLLGDSADVNRSTSVSILEMAEMQIFAAERKAFDFWMDHVFLATLDVRYHRFQSLGPQMEDLEAAATSLTELVRAWIITPEEARWHITENTSLDLEDIDEEWAKRPPEATMAGMGYESDSPDKPEELKRMEKEYGKGHAQRVAAWLRASKWMGRKDGRTGKTALDAVLDTAHAREKHEAEEAPGDGDEG